MRGNPRDCCHQPLWHSSARLTFRITQWPLDDRRPVAERPEKRAAGERLLCKFCLGRAVEADLAKGLYPPLDRFAEKPTSTGQRRLEIHDLATFIDA